MNEIRELIEKYAPQHITIYDDLFIAKKERLQEISNLIEVEGISKNVEFAALARVNLVDDQICILLKKMNITHMTCGFESGSPKILKYLKGLNVEQNAKAIELFKKYGFIVGGTFMIGIPNETISDMNMTLNFLRMNDFSAGDTYVMVPYPGTAIWEYAKSRNLVNDNMDWDLLGVDFAENWREAITVADQVSREELYVMYRKFKDEWGKKFVHGKTVFDVLHERGLGYIIKTGVMNPRRAISFIKNFLDVNNRSNL